MGKVVVITGAGGALGQAVVKKFSKDGFTVLATVSPGKQLGYEVEGKVIVHPVDLTKETDVAKFVRDAIAAHKSIDACICLAGGFALGDLEATDSALLNKMMAVNFDTAYHMVRHVHNNMANQKTGRIILVGSKPGMKVATGKNMVAYTLSKSLIFRLAEIINADVERNNVQCHVVVPTTIDTPANRSAMPTADFTAWTTPQKIAAVMAGIVAGSNTQYIREV